jgi:phosphoribosylformimino-5-aminoimidazole carboxamide ribotide isomerase
LELYPAIDLYGGKAVRLLHGNYEEMTIYSDDPAAVAEEFRQAGARYLHLVDLEAARDGGTPNLATIQEICAKSALNVEIGGGVRNMHTAEAYLELGAKRVIIGTAAVTDPDFLREALREFGDKIAIAVDIKGGFVATHGWVQTSEETCFDFCRKLENKGVKTVICTDISKDGALTGVNTALYAKLADHFSMDIVASGGVHTMDDLTALAGTGVSAAILGRALYTGSIDLKEAIELIDKVSKNVD